MKDNSIAYECRTGCGACCIAPSITTPFFGMPSGKKSGERCVHLTANEQCALFGRPERPDFCSSLPPHPEMCGNSRHEAMVILTDWEELTSPVNKGVDI